MKKEFLFYTVVVGFFGIILISCMQALPDVGTMPQVCFTTDVLPVFQGTCASKSGCHTENDRAGGFSLFKYSSIMNSGTVTRGDAKNSAAYQAIIAKWFDAMPPDKPISTDDRNLIRIWIEQGAMDCDTTMANKTKSN